MKQIYEVKQIFSVDAFGDEGPALGSESVSPTRLPPGARRTAAKGIQLYFTVVVFG